MNNLEPKDAVLTKSHTERIQLLEQLEEAGIEISLYTWGCRHSQESFDEYPVIFCNTKHISARTINNFYTAGYNELTMEDYLMKAGIGPKSKYYGNIIKHHFI
jgi:hypothetical protein